MENAKHDNNKDCYGFIREKYKENKGFTPWIQGYKTVVFIGDPIKFE
jgi:hypothetical protein